MRLGTLKEGSPASHVEPLAPVDRVSLRMRLLYELDPGVGLVTAQPTTAFGPAAVSL